MRIISCYIENFGGLHQFSYDFDAGLNVICEKNGWGKTTLAAFLKAMFYGLEQSAKHKLEENEKKKFTPWNGGAYGGNLTFEAEGREYRVERFFGGKDKEDTFMLYDVATGLESDAYTENLGEELFGIDRTAFEQSIFMKQGTYAVSMTDSVATKMSGLMASGDDVDRYAKACERLENEMKVYKKIGNKGKIAELTDEIADLKHRIAEAKQTGATLKDWKAKAQQCELEIAECKTRKESLKAQMRKAGEQAGMLEKSKHYRTLLEEKEKLGRSVEELECFFRNGVPGEEELQEYQNKLFSYKSVDGKVSEPYQQSFKYPGFVKLLEKNPMTEEELEVCEKKWNLLQEKENLLEKKEIQLQALQIREEEKDLYLHEKAAGIKSRQRIFIILAVVALLGAVAFYFTVGLTYALIAVAFMACMSIIAIVLSIKNKKTMEEADRENEELLQAENEYNEFKTTIECGKKSIRMYLQAFPIDRDEEITVILNQIRITIMEMNAGEEREKEIKQAEEKRVREKKLLRDELILFLRRFYDGVSEVEEYLLKEIVQKRNEYLNVSGQYEAKCKQLAQTERVETIPAEQMLSMEKLQSEEAVLEREILSKEEHLRQLNTTISEYTEMMAECEKWEMEKLDLEEVLAESQAKYKLLEKTLKYLKTAQAEFSSRYLKKINEGFHKYAKLIHEDKLKNSEVDLKLAVKTDESGVKREVAYFSKGMRDAMELCTRFALVDALFDKETPFIVLDDPFVNLDAKALEGASEVLTKLATQYQLIYFTCHPSRK